MFTPLFLKKQADQRLRAGHLWIYSNEVDNQKSPLSCFEPGQMVTLHSHDKKLLGSGYINPHSLICVRLISCNSQQNLDRSLLIQRLNVALALRERLFTQPYYRLIFGEGDYLPGLVVDRFGDIVVVQITTAGMEQRREEVIAAIDSVLQPTAIVLRNDVSIREREGLNTYVTVASGTLPTEVLLEENQVRFHVPVLEGQKTGWFYDHRFNRARATQYAQQQRVLDVFSYGGAWGIQAAVAGAREVWCVDSSQTALEYVKRNAELNRVSSKVQTVAGDAFDILKILRQEGQRFDVVILDPPAFIKRKKDQKEGELAYRRINQIAMQLLQKNGILISASCSLHLQRDVFIGLLGVASQSVKQSLQILEQGHQGCDHPIHPAIPETDYLKMFIGRTMGN